MKWDEVINVYVSVMETVTLQTTSKKTDTCWVMVKSVLMAILIGHELNIIYNVFMFWSLRIAFMWTIWSTDCNTWCQKPNSENTRVNCCSFSWLPTYIRMSRLLLWLNGSIYYVWIVVLVFINRLTAVVYNCHWLRYKLG